MEWDYGYYCLPKRFGFLLWIHFIKEFKDEIDAWVIEEFRKVGLDTAKSVLELSAEDLIKRTDLEEETVSSVLKVLKEEFED